MCLTNKQDVWWWHRRWGKKRRHLAASQKSSTQWIEANVKKQTNERRKTNHLKIRKNYYTRDIWSTFNCLGKNINRWRRCFQVHMRIYVESKTLEWFFAFIFLIARKDQPIEQFSLNNNWIKILSGRFDFVSHQKVEEAKFTKWKLLGPFVSKIKAYHRSFPRP